MMNLNSLFLQATSLLLILVGYTASATFVEKTNNDTSRDLIGFHDMMNIHSSQDRIPTMYPTAAAPTPYPVEGAPTTQTQGRLETPVEEAPTTQTQGRLDPTVPTPSPTLIVPIVPGAPTNFPTFPPTPFPTQPKPTLPTEAPSSMPSDLFSLTPSMSLSPTAPTTSPSMGPTQTSSVEPSNTPSETPSSEPSASPSAGPSGVPTTTPSVRPSEAPSITPSDGPSNLPTVRPSEAPSITPTDGPSAIPTEQPSDEPSEYPSDEPSEEPSTEAPSGTPVPSDIPTATDAPSDIPTATEEPSEIIFESSDVPTDNNEGNALDGRADIDDRRSSQSPVSIPSESPSTDSPSISEVLPLTESQTISETICDTDNADLWGTLCAALKEANLFETLGGTGGPYTLFAPTNDAFDIGDYTLDVLFQDQTALQNLMSMHIAPLALPYDALLCNLNTEMLNFDVTYTLCIGSVRFQTADGNEIRNLPVIDQPEDIRTKNGIIHAISNLILPFQFSIDNIIKETTETNINAEIEDDSSSETFYDINEYNAIDISWNVSDILSDDFEESTIDDEIEGNWNTSDIDGSWNVSDILSDDFEESTIDDEFEGNWNASDIDGSWNVSDILSDDFEERTIDDVIEGNWNASDTSSDDSASSRSSIMNSVSEHITNRTGLMDNGDEVGCQVCESRELCAIPPNAVMLVPGEGEVPCINVINRQNKGEGIIMGPSMCIALQERFQESCLIGDGEN